MTGWVLGALMLAALASASPGLESVATPHPLNSTAITVSGVSSGASFAVQFHVAFSSLVTGAAVFAGKPYHCEQENRTAVPVNYTKGFKCNQHPSLVDVPGLVQYTRTMADQGRIDDPGHLQRARVFLFRGRHDTIYAEGAVNNTQAYYQGFMPAASILSMIDSSPAGHCIPTVHNSSGVALYPPTACGAEGLPYLERCGLDGAGLALGQLLGPLAPSTAAVSEGLLKLNQTSFDSVPGYLSQVGYFYVPRQCSRAQCRLHVNLHGCSMSADHIGTDYLLNAGFNEWAEANSIVVLYPQIRGVGCWDNYGDSGVDYCFKTGTQMAAVRRMVGAVLGNLSALLHRN